MVPSAIYREEWRAPSSLSCFQCASRAYYNDPLNADCNSKFLFVQSKMIVLHYIQGARLEDVHVKQVLFTRTIDNPMPPL